MNNLLKSLATNNSTNTNSTTTKRHRLLHQGTLSVVVVFELHFFHKWVAMNTSTQQRPLPLILIDPARNFLLTPVTQSGMQESSVDIRSPPSPKNEVVPRCTIAVSVPQSLLLYSGIHGIHPYCSCSDLGVEDGNLQD